MKKLKFRGSSIITACLAFWSLFLVLIVTPSLFGGNMLTPGLLPLIGLLAAILTPISVILLITGLSARDPKNERFTSSPLAKALAVFILVALVTSTYTTLKSLWFSPFDDTFGDKFLYENIATGVGFAAIVMTFILSALQKDIYWVTRKKTASLDERQLHQRQQVFETSYKLGAFLVLGAAWFFANTIHNIPAIVANHYGSIPGHLYWLPFNVALTLFALPLITAAWKKN